MTSSADENFLSNMCHRAQLFCESSIVYSLLFQICSTHVSHPPRCLWELSSIFSPLSDILYTRVTSSKMFVQYILSSFRYLLHTSHPPRCLYSIFSPLSDILYTHVTPFKMFVQYILSSFRYLLHTCHTLQDVWCSEGRLWLPLHRWCFIHHDSRLCCITEIGSKESSKESMAVGMFLF